MRIAAFELEQYQADHEDHVEFNLAGSGARSRTLGDLYELGLPELSESSLGYPIAKGSPALLENISSWYPGSEPGNVVPTNGGCEANFLTLWSLLEPDDEVAMMVPNFLQPIGVAAAFGRVRSFRLARSEAPTPRWALDAGSLLEAVTPATKIVWVCNPNNPTGSVLSLDEMDQVVSAAASVGAWIVSDEIYRGAELHGADTTPTFWGRYDKVIVTASLSKAFGLAGLRLGWAIGPQEQIAELRMHRDYTSTMVGHLSDTLGSFVLDPANRDVILGQTRSTLTADVEAVDDWAGQHETLAYAPPSAGAIAYVELPSTISDVEFCHRVREDRSVLLVPGTFLGMAGGVRVGFGSGAETTRAGLERVDSVLVDFA